MVYSNHSVLAIVIYNLLNASHHFTGNIYCHGADVVSEDHFILLTPLVFEEFRGYCYSCHPQNKRERTFSILLDCCLKSTRDTN